MNSLIFNRLTLVALMLVGATLLSFEFMNGLLPFDGRRYAAIAILIVAFIKVHFVGLEFMELRAAPMIARLLFEAWAVTVCAAMIVVYSFKIVV